MNRRNLLSVAGTGAIGIVGISGKGIAQSGNFSIQLTTPITHQSSGTGEPITARQSLEIDIDRKISLVETATDLFRCGMKTLVQMY